MAKLEAKGEASDIPSYPDKSNETDVWEVDPRTGKPKKKSKTAEEQEDASSDDMGEPSPVPEREVPQENTSPQIPGATRIAALMIVNSGRMRRGLPLLSKLVQDESITDLAQIPATIEARARAIIAAGRRARGLTPLPADEWISVNRFAGRGDMLVEPPIAGGTMLVANGLYCARTHDQLNNLVVTNPTAQTASAFATSLGVSTTYAISPGAGLDRILGPVLAGGISSTEREP